MEHELLIHHLELTNGLPQRKLRSLRSRVIAILQHILSENLCHDDDRKSRVNNGKEIEREREEDRGSINR